jgi:hypothetical protein
VEEYRCYFISRDGTGRSLASISAVDPATALEIAIRRLPHLQYRFVEVWHNSDRVLATERRRVNSDATLSSISPGAAARSRKMAGVS